MLKYACVLPVALIGIVGLSQLGDQQANVLRGRAHSTTIEKLGADAGASTDRWGVNLPSLVSDLKAGVGAALVEATRLARQVASGVPVNVDHELALLARRFASVSVLDEFKGFVTKLRDDEWQPRLIPGLDPNTPWRDLDIVSVDLEGKMGEPTQIGLVQISGRELGNEVTIRMTPASGETTKKATRLRLLDSSKEVSSAGRFEQSQEIFESFTRGRLPLAFQHQGDLQGLMHEWSQLQRPGKDGFYVVEPEVEWIDVANWSRLLSSGDKNSLSHVHWRVLDEPLRGAHVGVNDARAAARVLYRLGDQHPAMPQTYGDLVKYQVAWRKYRSELNAVQAQRLQAAISAEEVRLRKAYEEELSAVRAGQSGINTNRWPLLTSD